VGTGRIAPVPVVPLSRTHMKVAGGGTSSDGSERLPLPAAQALIWGVGCSRSCNFRNRSLLCSGELALASACCWHSARASSDCGADAGFVAQPPSAPASSSKIVRIMDSQIWEADDQSAMAARRLVYSRAAAKAGRRRGARPPGRGLAGAARSAPPLVNQDGLAARGVRDRPYVPTTPWALAVVGDVKEKQAPSPRSPCRPLPDNLPVERVVESPPCACGKCGAIRLHKLGAPLRCDLAKPVSIGPLLGSYRSFV
jgi:hypothetical protein